MIHKNRVFKIDEKDIFQNDKLKRQESIENLSMLISNTTEAFTISINADWGAGKTTFVKLLKAYLKKEFQIQSIYFSAWEDDFSNEPLISILGEINSYISENFNQKSEQKSEIGQGLEKVKSYGGKIIKRGLPAFIKGTTAGLLDIDKGFENAVGAMSEEFTKELIENYSTEKELTQKLQESLKTLLSLINNEKTFVIFIDELDRCRPLYAIELLERIKHIFGVDNLVFVLSIDKKQLSESIKSQYGNIDTNSYLKRFIDLEYNLQNPNRDDFCSFLYYQEFEIDKAIKSKDIKSSHGDLEDIDMLKYLAESLKLTLREIEQVFIQINIVFKTIQPRFYSSHFKVLVFFIVLKIKDSNLYFDLINKRQSPNEIIKKVVLPQKRGNSYHDLSTIIKSIIYATSATDEELFKIIKIKKEELAKIIDTSSSKYREQEWLITLLKHDYGDYHGYNLHRLIETVIKKVEFLDRFNLEVSSDENN